MITQATSPEYDRTLQKLADLEAALLAQDPDIARHVSEIHRLLISFDDVVVLLTEEQIAVLMKGNQIVTGQVLTQQIAKKKTSRAAHSLDDL